MAEIIGVIAAIGALTEFGFKLSLKLFTYSQAILTADQTARDISNEVSLTSTVLQQLSSTLKHDRQIASDIALNVIHEILKDCDTVFQELDGVLEPVLSKLNDQGPSNVGKRVERFVWPLKQSKVDALKERLDRLKLSLTLMLQALSHARDIANQ
ncbi:hypothetical protein SCUP515_04813 [Seiridium cupressi]